MSFALKQGFIGVLTRVPQFHRGVLNRGSTGVVLNRGSIGVVLNRGSIGVVLNRFHWSGLKQGWS